MLHIKRHVLLIEVLHIKKKRVLLIKVWHIKKCVAVIKNIRSSQDSFFLQSFVLNCVFSFSLCESLKKDQNILYDMLYEFQTGHSTDHVIVHLAAQIYKAFEKNEYTLGVFIDLSKVFKNASSVLDPLCLQMKPTFSIPTQTYKNYFQW